MAPRGKAPALAAELWMGKHLFSTCYDEGGNLTIIVMIIVIIIPWINKPRLRLVNWGGTIKKYWIMTIGGVPP